MAIAIDNKTITEAWVRNESDARAMAAGYTFSEVRAVFTVWWVEHYCTLYEGEWAGEPMRLHGAATVDEEFPIDLNEQWGVDAEYNALARAEAYREHVAAGNLSDCDWQYECTMRLFGWEGYSRRWKRPTRRFRRANIWVAKKNKKALSLTTVVPTPTGWSTVADLRVGDMVFDAEGKPTHVIDETPVFHGRPCYEVEFSNGQKVVCDEGHLWVTRSLREAVSIGGRGNQKRFCRIRCRETKEIAETLFRDDGARCHSLDMPYPIECLPSALPVSPYVLGAWLGDGDSDAARLTVHQDDFEHFRREFINDGWPLREFKRKPDSLAGRVAIGKRWGRFRTLLREMDLFKHKHIPSDYLRGSIRQRLALLQGLMDTDGCASKSGQCIFSTSNDRLMVDVAELLASLGIKFSCERVERTQSWRFTFHAFKDILPVFRMARKLERLRVSDRNTMGARSRTLQIVSVQPVASVPVKCITVGSSTSQFLVGQTMIPTHNSPTLTGLGLYLMAGDGEMGQHVYFGAKDGMQARGIMGEHAMAMLEQSTALRAECVANKNRMRITHTATRSFMEPLSSSNTRTKESKEGLNGDLIVDESHIVDRDFIARVERMGISRAEPFHIEGSTAGSDPDSYGKEQYDWGKLVESGAREDHRFFHAAYEAPAKLSDKELASDPVKYAKMANPAWGHTIDEEEFLADYNRSKRSPLRLAECKMYRLNMWQRAGAPWLVVDDWNKGQRDFTNEDLYGRECWTAADFSRTRDMTALCLAFPEEGSDVIKFLWWHWLPEEYAHENADKAPFLDFVQDPRCNFTLTPGGVIDPGYIVSQFRELSTKFKFMELAYDDWNAELITQQVSEGIKDPLGKVIDPGIGVERHPFSQAIKQFNEPTQEFERRVILGQILHTGDPCLEWQVQHATLREDTNGNIKPVKPKKDDVRKVDGLVTGVMSMARAIAAPRPHKSPYATRGILTT